MDNYELLEKLELKRRQINAQIVVVKGLIANDETSCKKQQIHLKKTIAAYR